MKLVFFFLTFFLSLVSFAQVTSQSNEREIVFRNVTVLPMDTELLLRNKDVRVKNGKIISIANSGMTKVTKDAIVIEGDGKFLLPGLAEMHAHVPPVDNLEAMKDVVSLFALNGITTIRGMLGHPRHLELRQKLESGEVFGPRFYTSGPSFNGQSVKTVTAAEAMVREQKNAGYDFLKLHPGLTTETFSAIAKTAQEVNIPFAGHVSFDVGVWRAIDARYATIDHLDGFVESLVPTEEQTEQSNGIFGINLGDKADTTKIAPLMKALREKQVWVVPTQALAERWFAPGKSTESLRSSPEMKYMPSATLDNWSTNKNNLQNNLSVSTDAVNRFIALRRYLIKRCQESGVGLLLGSDAPQVFNVPGFSTHQELQYMVDAGLTPFQALQTGTFNVGKFLQRSDIGVIKEGAVADLVLLTANPLMDIANTQKIEGVMVNGRWLSKAAISQQLKKLEKSN